MDLNQKKCRPCSAGLPALTEEEIQAFLKQVQGWSYHRGKKRISKSFQFKNFLEAVDFINRLAPVAEEENHHPDICIYYSTVDIQLWTHAISGLSENDFILASKIDRAVI